jgi:electron transfer flavoprotein alpha subunit
MVMGNVLIIAEHKDGKLKKASRAAFTFARKYTEKFGGKLHILVIGQGVAGVAEQCSKFGAEKVWLADDANLAAYLAESYSQVAAEAAQKAGASIIGATTSAMSKDLLPRLAARLKAGMASDIMGFTDQGYFLRPVWAGNAVVEAEITTAVKVVSVRGTEFEPAAEQASASPVEKFPVALNPASWKKRFVRFQEVKSARPELTEAAIIVTGGRGTKGPEGFQLVERLADLLGAAVGATRAAVDAGWVPNDLQVGQTGKVVAPDLYIAVGVSGAIQHLAGMKGSKVIVAINKDEEAPIFSVADYGLVADLFKAVPELVEEIKKARA